MNFEVYTPENKVVKVSLKTAETDDVTVGELVNKISNIVSGKVVKDSEPNDEV